MQLNKFFHTSILCILLLGLQACLPFGATPPAEEPPGPQGVSDRGEDEMEFTEEEVEPSTSNPDSLLPVSDQENILASGTFEIVYEEGTEVCLKEVVRTGIDPIETHTAHFNVRFNGNLIEIQNGPISFTATPKVGSDGELIIGPLGATYEGRFQSPFATTIMEFLVFEGQLIGGTATADPLENSAGCKISYEFNAIPISGEMDFSGDDE